ncbi:hypothetical protein GALMADRAFT_227856 [Galerina marginata CBS 339.88]|uniref:Uncharacterized protein n=1 Tax=Galerina marginata (strain CBS 339.88) TaxID=685588 RepID=A0A067STB4_GALM3|nr:hypothetical protein GALMADRAFT_227856 [Galerina marginata CBS 339.88]
MKERLFTRHGRPTLSAYTLPLTTPRLQLDLALTTAQLDPEVGHPEWHSTERQPHHCPHIYRPPSAAPWCGVASRSLGEERAFLGLGMTLHCTSKASGLGQMTNCSHLGPGWPPLSE